MIMVQTLDLPTLGILFKVEKIEELVDSGNYLVGAWKVLWRALGPENLKDFNGLFLYECDTDGGIDGCCIAVQSTDRSLLKKIKDHLANNEVYLGVADEPMFLLDEKARAQPLMTAGMIGYDGKIEGESTFCPRSALEAVRAVPSTPGHFTSESEDSLSNDSLIAAGEGTSFLPEKSRFSGPAVLIGILLICLAAGIFLGVLFSRGLLFPEQTSPAASRYQADSGKEIPDSLRDANIDADALIRLGNSYFDAKLPEKAIKTYRMALEIDPEKADVWTDMGIMYRELGQVEDALKSFDKAIAIDSRHVSSRYNKGVVMFIDLQDKAGALKVWEDLARVNPSAKVANDISIQELIREIKGEGRGGRP